MVRSCKHILLSVCLLLTACQEGRDAGDLLGQWRLTDSDTKYVSFSGSVALFRSTTEGQVFGNFQHVGDSLFIQCYSINGEKSDTTMVEESYGFRPFNNIRLKIEKLDSDRLILSKEGRTWNFFLY